MAQTTIERRSLILGEELGKGGQGTVYSVVHEFEGRTVVYKDYRDPRSANSTRLRRMVDHYQHLPSSERAVWLDCFAWPLAVVEPTGIVVGFLMPTIPDRYYTDVTTGRGVNRRLATFEYLLNSETFIAQRGISLTRTDQIDLLSAVACYMDLLHSADLAVGDLSPINLLFHVTPQMCDVFFLDCDAMQYAGESDVDQVETPAWGVPVQRDGAREPLGTIDSDRYKIGLLVVRLLAGRQDGASAAMIPDDVSSLRHLARRALEGPPSSRPSMAEWLDSLTVARRQAGSTNVHCPTPSVPIVNSGDDRDDVDLFAWNLNHRAESVLPTTPTQPNPHRPGAIWAAALVVLAVVGVIVWQVGKVDSAERSADAPSTGTPLSARYTPPTYTPPSYTPPPTYERPTQTARTYTPERDTPEPPTTTPMPGPPTMAVSPGSTWRVQGPYASDWTCDQTRGQWPVATSVCFPHDGSSYFWGLIPPQQQ